MAATPPDRKWQVLVPIVTFVLAIAAVEFAFRLFSPNFYVNERSFIESIRIREPFMDYVINRRFIAPDDPEVRLRTDARSYYLPSVRFEKPDVTIAFFGGSTTECGAVKEELRFPALVSRRAEKQGIDVNVLNVAHSGNTLHDSINVLLNHVVLDRPDIAVVMHASNDIGVLREYPDYGPRMARPLDASDFLRWVKQWASGHSWFVARMRYAIAEMEGMGVKPVLMREQNVLPDSAFPEQQYRNRVRAFVALARSLDIEPVLMTEPYAQFRTNLTPEWKNDTVQDEANRVLRGVGSESGVLVIDLMAHMQATVPDFNEPMAVFYDAIHFTDRGSQVVGEYIAARLHESGLLKRRERG